MIWIDPNAPLRRKRKGKMKYLPYTTLGHRLKLPTFLKSFFKEKGCLLLLWRSSIPHGLICLKSCGPARGTDLRAYRTFRKWTELEEMGHLVTGTECRMHSLLPVLSVFLYLRRCKQAASYWVVASLPRWTVYCRSVSQNSPFLPCGASSTIGQSVEKSN